MISKNISAVLFALLLTNCSSATRQIAQAKPDCTIKTGTTYPTVPMRTEFVALDQQFGRVPQYYTPAVREDHRFIVFNGTVYKNDCTLMNMPDGIDPSTNLAQTVNYVMDPAGNFYWVDEYKDALTRHSAVFDAQPVSGAGDINISNSKITSIDANSGHYPTGTVFDNVLKQLTLDGVDLTQVTVTHTPNSP
jgi:hypothetical protein